MFNFTSISTIQYLAIIGNLLLPIILVTISMPYFIKKFTESGVLGRDYYKKGVVKIPESGGIVILLITLLSISFTSLFFKYSTTNYVVLIVICLFGIFGILDDMIDIGRVSKLFLMYYCSYPLIQYATSTALVLPSVVHIELGILYLQFIVPTYVLVASNLVNMHSGYNGLASGLSAIVLLSLIIKSIMLGDVENIFTIVAITGALLGYFLYDRFPSQIFWGNVGSLTIGATIGALIVIQGFIISGFIMLIPHTVNFLLYVYWRVRKFPVAKFGHDRGDGILEVPNPYTLKWVLPYYYNLTEKQATYAMYMLTGIFCLIGIFLPGKI